jgi:hypothetical protein
MNKKTYTFFDNINKDIEVYIYAVHDYFKHAAGQDIFLLNWRQVLSYDVSFLNIRIVVNSVINLVNKNLPRTALQICMFHLLSHLHPAARQFCRSTYTITDITTK